MKSDSIDTNHFKSKLSDIQQKKSLKLIQLKSINKFMDAPHNDV